MLEEAGYQRDVERRDVVAGVVEAHGRFEINTLLANFEKLTSGTKELDLDAALAREPSLILIDELAHTNENGARHQKRWQDVEELLDAGTDVYTTLNVQHVESLNDVVARVTGVVVKDTVPDSVIDAADQIKLIDLPPDELLERLREGKVFLPAQVEAALENLFQKGNLIALRELALRKTAERVDADMQAWREANAIERAWTTSDRLLVCIGPSPFSANLLRVGRRMAKSLHASWLAVNVETPATLRLGREDRTRIQQNLRLAEQLGAEVVTLNGAHAAETLLAFAREHGVTKIVVGKPRVRRLRDHLFTPFVDELIVASGDIDVYVTVGDDEPAPPPVAGNVARARAGYRSYAAAVIIVGACVSVAAVLFGPDHLADVVMTLLLGVVVVATRFGFRASVLAAVLSVLSFDFVFVPPFVTFSVNDLRHTVTFAVMLVVAVVIAGLTERVREQASVAMKGERRIAVLHAMSRDLSRLQGSGALLERAAKHVEEFFQAKVSVVSRSTDGLALSYVTEGFESPIEADRAVLEWVEKHQREAGAGTTTLSSASGFYLPLVASGERGESLGVLGIHALDEERFVDIEQRRMADAFAGQMAMALERGKLSLETETARREIEAEQLRSTLLSSVSHDLRTPLAVMKGAATTLLDADAALQPEVRRELVQALVEESDRLDRLVRDLLDMTRIESGGVRVKKEWQSVEEVVGAAINRTETLLADRRVAARVPGELLAAFDGVLVQQLLVNLLENAAKYTPAGTPIEVEVEAFDEEIQLRVLDRGAGIAPEEVTRIFEKFHRGVSDRTKAGVGLGLTICRAISVAHGGRIWVENREGGGAVFTAALPREGSPPSGGLPELDLRGT